MFRKMTCAAARAAGLTRYFTGRPCPRGHRAERMVSNNTCVVCKRIALKRWRIANPDQARALIRASTARYRKANAKQVRARYAQAKSRQR